jgi:hypothetical protein
VASRNYGIELNGCVAVTRWEIESAVLSIINLLEAGDWRVRLDTVKAIGKFADHCESHPDSITTELMCCVAVLRVIGAAISPLIALLEDLDVDVRLGAVEAVGKFSADGGPHPQSTSTGLTQMCSRASAANCSGHPIAHKTAR